MSLVSCSHANMFQTFEGEPLRMCTPPELVMVSARVPRDWRPSIESALQYWNNAMGMTLFYYAGESPDTYLGDQVGYLLVDLGEDEVMDQKNACGLTIYKKNLSRECILMSVILIRYRDVKSWDDHLRFESMMRHEFGHALGLGHSDYEGDLMYGRILKDVEHPQPAHPSAIQKALDAYINH